MKANRHNAMLIAVALAAASMHRINFANGASQFVNREQWRRLRKSKGGGNGQGMTTLFCTQFKPVRGKQHFVRIKVDALGDRF